MPLARGVKPLAPLQRRFGTTLACIALTTFLLAGLGTWRSLNAAPALDWSMTGGEAEGGGRTQLLRGRGLGRARAKATIDIDLHASGRAGDADGKQQQASFHPGEPWLDEDRVLIQAHGGGVLFYEGRYYWFGEHKGGPTYTRYSAAYSPPRVDVIGVGCYSSADLLHWRNEGLALKAGSHPDLDPSNVLERPKVLFHGPSRRFVMWMHIDTADYEWARLGVAVATRVSGPYSFLRSFRPHNQMARDFTVFQDDDGAGYVAYSSEDNAVMHVARLTDDYAAVTPNYSRVLVGLKREAPALFKHGGYYLMLTSGCTGWAPNRAEVYYAKDMLGEWRSLGNPMAGATAMDRAYTFYSQPSFVFPLQGAPAGRYVMMADQWDTENLGASRYVWLPLWIEPVPPDQLAAAEADWRGNLSKRLEASGGLGPWVQPPPGPLHLVVPWRDAWHPADLLQPLDPELVSEHWRELRAHPLA